MVAFIVTIHVLVSLFLIFVILLQPGKGDGMGGALGGGGGGGSGTVFGSRGSVTFLAKVTEVCAVIFMVTSLTLAYRSSHSDSVLSARRHLAAQEETKKQDEAAKKAGVGTTPPGQSVGGAATPPADGSKPAPAPTAPVTPPPAAPK